MRVTRRKLLELTLAGGAIIVVGCKGEGDASGVQPTDGGTEGDGGVVARAWALGSLELVEGSGKSLDLASTLPADVKPGGTFSLDPASKPLPSGMTLDPNGALSVGTARAGTFEGVVFAYAEPA